MSNHPFTEKNSGMQRGDLLAVGSILGYCLVYGILRLMISPSMELDEAEQFLKSMVFSWGHGDQPPLYSWIVRGAALLVGLQVETIVAVKYNILFLFYLSFYYTARSVWEAKESLLITGSLLLFPLYAYEFNRDLSHTILAALMASLTLLLYVKLLQKERVRYYCLLGVCIGLGILSKYTFVLFVIALLCASASFKEGRRVLLNRNTIVSLASCCLVLLPHLLWLMREDFLSFRYAVEESRAGSLTRYPLSKILPKLAAMYTGVMILSGTVMVFFRRSVSRAAALQGPEGKAFRWLALYGLSIPLITAVGLQTGYFVERWLAPILFVLPFALFSMIRLDMGSVRVAAFRSLCVVIGGAVLAARAVIGFAPETAGKVERIHIPFKEVSSRLAEEIRRDGFNDLREVAVISDSGHLAANLIAWMPGAKFVPFQSVQSARGIELRNGGVIVWNASKRGGALPREFAERFPDAVPLRPIAAPFLRAQRLPPYILGAAFIPRESVRQ